MTNLLRNSDFEGVLSTPFTNYQLLTQANGAGTAAVVSKAPAWGLGNDTGHGGSGKFLMVDGSVNANTKVWKQTVTLVAGQAYDFGAWVNANQGVELQLMINGVDVGASLKSAAGAGLGWEKWALNFTATQSGTVEIGIRDKGAQAAYNDFGLDDLSLSQHVAPVLPTDGNLLANANFEDGSNNFTTDYRILDQAIVSGTAAVVSQAPAGWDMGSNAAHGGAGKFLMVDGSANANAKAWQQNITLTAGKTYDFSAWVNANQGVALQLVVDGVDVGATLKPKAVVGTGWQNWALSFTAQRSGEVKIGIRDIATNARFNDFGLDDLSLRQKAQSTVLEGKVDLGPITSEGLLLTAYGLDGTAQSGTVAVNADGSYALVINNYSGPLTLKLTGKASYTNESGGTSVFDANAQPLHAVTVVNGGDAVATANVNPLTEIAARKILPIDQATGNITAPVITQSADAVTATNTAVSKALLGQNADITKVVPDTTAADGNNTSNAAGKFLALIAAAEQSSNLSTQEVIQTLANGLTVNATTVTASFVSDTPNASQNTHAIAAIDLLGQAASQAVQNGSLSASAAQTVVQQAVLDTGVSAPASVLITADKGNLGLNAATTVTFKFSQAPVNGSFDMSDVTVTGGQLSNLSASSDPTVYTAVFKPNDGVTEASLQVAASRFHVVGSVDSNKASNTLSLNVDTVAPEPTLIASAGPGLSDGYMNASEATAKVNVSYAGMKVGDLIALKLGDTTLSAVHGVNSAEASVGSVILTVNQSDLGADGDKTLQAVATDAASNEGHSSSLAFKLDTKPPTLTITSYDVDESIGNFMPSNVAVAKLQGTDASALSYRLGSKGADNHLFSLTADGALTMNTGKDFEDSAHANTYNVTLDITDAAGNVLNEKAFTVNVKDVNEPAVFVGNDHLELDLQSGFAFELQSFGGILSVTDPDAGQSNLQFEGQEMVAQLQGTYGTFTFTLNEGSAKWSYLADADLVGDVVAGMKLTDKITVTSVDGTTHDVVVNLNTPTNLIYGTSGDDVLTGTVGGDEFSNWLSGDDTATGGEGADIFKFNSQDVVGIFTKTITDFDVTVDTLDLSALSGAYTVNSYYDNALMQAIFTVTKVADPADEGLVKQPSIEIHLSGKTVGEDFFHQMAHLIV
jgi:VCBS repeat-containing protein